MSELKDRMEKALSTPITEVPEGLSRGEIRNHILSRAEQEAIPIKDHPLRDEIEGNLIDMLKKGELVIS